MRELTESAEDNQYKPRKPKRIRLGDHIKVNQKRKHEEDNNTA